MRHGTERMCGLFSLRYASEQADTNICYGSFLNGPNAGNIQLLNSTLLVHPLTRAPEARCRQTPRALPTDQVRPAPAAEGQHPRLQNRERSLHRTTATRRLPQRPSYTLLSRCPWYPASPPLLEPALIGRLRRVLKLPSQVV